VKHGGGIERADIPSLVSNPDPVQIQLLVCFVAGTGDKIFSVPGPTPPPK